jgi:hypothetical protein
VSSCKERLERVADCAGVSLEERQFSLEITQHQLYL